MIGIKVVILAVVAVLWYLGGQGPKWMRRVLVPIILGLACALLNRAWWLAIALAATYQVIRLGYGNWSEDDPKKSTLALFIAWLWGRDYQGALTRGLWGVTVAAVGALPLLLGQFLAWPLYALYVAVVALVSYLISKLRLPVLLADLLVGASIASVIFLLHP